MVSSLGTNGVGFYTMAVPGEKEPLSRVEENALTFSKNNLTEQRMVEIYCEMLEFEPVWMILQPSVGRTSVYGKSAV